MILTVDIGNTNITTGVYNKNDLLFVMRAATDRTKSPDQYAVELRSMLDIHNALSFNFSGAIISSVVPEITNAVKDAVQIITGQTALLIGPGVKTGLNIRIDNPAQLGADLVAGAVGALNKYKMPCLVLDMGTANKISVLDSKGNYRGCTISAGIGISLRALSSGTSQLPAIPLNAPQNAIGTNTIDSMQSGTVLGAAAMIEGLCARLEENLGEKIETIVATGGISGDIIRYCRMDIIHDPDLILDGLRFILEKNTI
ncbi:MAG: type III pantothenate kinase [Clostridia bacterium]|nr:type III pantothenate kinase [Clostridia bacterium]